MGGKYYDGASGSEMGDIDWIYLVGTGGGHL